MHETRYWKKVRNTVQAYIQPLQVTRHSHGLSAEDQGAIFRTLETIGKVHDRLAPQVAKHADHAHVVTGVELVAKVYFEAREALLETYGPYALKHGEAMAALRAARARPAVAQALNIISSQDPKVEGESLESLLSLPLSYALELRDLFAGLRALCNASEPGFAALEAVCGTLNEISAAVARGGGAAAATVEAPGAGAPQGAAGQVHESIARVLTAGQYGSLRPALPAASPAPAAAAAAAPPPAAPAGSASMPLPRSAVVTGEVISTDAVVGAQNEADLAARRLDEMELEVQLKEQELKLAQEEVARVEAEARKRGLDASGGGGGGGGGVSASALDASLRALQEEERELMARLSTSENRGVFEMFLHRKKELEAEEAKLSATLAEHEETLSQIRMRLANPPTSVLPSDQAKAALYLSWKRALAEREELLRQARRRKHELLRDLKARFETQVVLLELERRSAVDGLKEAVAAEKAKVETYKAELVSVESSIESARAAMKRFRDEFESLRVGLLMDRMAKSQQVANLSERRSRLEREAAQFQEAVEAARQKVAAEESAKWEAKLAEERERGERRIAEEQKLIAAKIEQVRNALAERYEAGFRPLLRETEARHVEELQRVVALQRELEAKEAELRAAHETARGLSAAVTVASEGGAAVRDPTTSEVVPEWKLREFEDLKAAVAGLWEQLDVPAEDITAFLSEADLMAPYSPQGAWR